jgi:hypothetical protein
MSCFQRDRDPDPNTAYSVNNTGRRCGNVAEKLPAAFLDRATDAAECSNRKTREIDISFHRRPPLQQSRRGLMAPLLEYSASENYLRDTPRC